MRWVVELDKGKEISNSKINKYSTVFTRYLCEIIGMSNGGDNGRRGTTRPYGY